MRILHILRAPVGGLFRHVVDLAEGQIERGHEVGIVADCGTSNPVCERMIASLTPRLGLFFSRTAIPREPGPGDFRALGHVVLRLYETGADVIHGHGAKGGALARLAPSVRRALRVYTPHGGSLHDAVGNRKHIAMERLLKWRSDLSLFESAYSADMYRRKVGTPRGIVRVVHNGVRPGEFDPVALCNDATDVVYVGEMRDLKGVDLLIDALAALRREGRAVTATLVGDGPQLNAYRQRVACLGLDGQVVFPGALPAREAFTRGRVVVVPSRAESFPYVVLEAAAAGKPLVATQVGGIPEIFGRQSDRLIAAGQMEPLRDALRSISDEDDIVVALTRDLQARVRQKFSVAAMVDAVLDAYDQGLALRNMVPAAAPGEVCADVKSSPARRWIVSSDRSCS